MIARCDRDETARTERPPRRRETVRAYGGEVGPKFKKHFLNLFHPTRCRYPSAPEHAPVFWAGFHACCVCCTPVADRQDMNLTDLKRKPVPELLDTAREMGLDNLNRSRKQEVIAAILRKHAKSGEDIYGDGTLEILQDGFGFLRSADSSYLAGPDDIYVSPSQIRRFNLRTGDSIAGKIRPPKDGERYFALLKVDEINFSEPNTKKHKILFENLTPLFPQQALSLERGNGSSEDLAARVVEPRRADRQGPTWPHRLAAEGGQDAHAAEHRAVDRGQQSRKSCSSCCSSTSARKR